MAEKKVIKIKYDCGQCPGYCCSYPRIEVKDSDIERLAKHFGIDFSKAKRKFTKLYEPGERILKHKADTVYATICSFFDQDERRCTVYKARPDVCRAYPAGKTCGYYDFLKFERKHQGDQDFIPSA